MSKIWRLPVVREETGLCTSSIYYMMDRGLFPRPIRLGLRAVGWQADEIQAWKADRIAARDAEIVKRQGRRAA